MFELPNPQRIIDIGINKGRKVDSHCYPPRPSQDKTSERLSHASDGSTALFTLYLRISEEHNQRKYEVLKGDLDSILVYCGLFSATVAALIMPSITGGQDPTSAPSESDPSTTSDTSPSLLVQISNVLWYYSLLLSIFCATHALIRLRSSNPRTWVTSPRCCLPERARADVNSARTLEGANKSMSIFLYVILFSLFLLYSGLACYFFAADFFRFYLSLTFVIFFPISVFNEAKNLLYRRRSPHCTPYTQDKIKERGSRLDGEVLKRTLDMTTQRSDDDLEQFFDAIPGFCASEIVDNPRRSLDVLGLPRLAEALIEFWNRTLLSNRVSEFVKARRLIVCVKVIEAADLTIAVPQILHLFSGDLNEVSRSLKIGHSLRPLRNGNAASIVRGMIASIISDAERDGRWSIFAMDELGISRDVLRDYLAHGDSVLLANLIHITRHFLEGLLRPRPDLTREALTILPSVSEFDILNTLPELQHDFCALWNDVVRQVESTIAEDNPFKTILHDIWGFYVALHSTTASKYDLMHPPMSYPLCEDESHRNVTTHVQ